MKLAIEILEAAILLSMLFRFEMREEIDLLLKYILASLTRFNKTFKSSIGVLVF
jgi:hypothetical protein